MVRCPATASSDNKGSIGWSDDKSSSTAASAVTVVVESALTPHQDAQDFPAIEQEGSADLSAIPSLLISVLPRISPLGPVSRDAIHTGKRRGPSGDRIRVMKVARVGGLGMQERCKKTGEAYEKDTSREAFHGVAFF